MKRRFEIEKVKEVDYAYTELGIRYNVQMWISFDGGKRWCYSGTGRYCKSMEEAQEYIKSFEE